MKISVSLHGKSWLMSRQGIFFHPNAFLGLAKQDRDISKLKKPQFTHPESTKKNEICDFASQLFKKVKP